MSFYWKRFLEETGARLKTWRWRLLLNSGVQLRNSQEFRSPTITQDVRCSFTWTHPHIEVDFLNVTAAFVQVQAELVQAQSLLQKVTEVVLQKVPTGPLLDWARPGEKPARHRARECGEREQRGGGGERVQQQPPGNCITDWNKVFKNQEWAAASYRELRKGANRSSTSPSSQKNPTKSFVSGPASLLRFMKKTHSDPAWISLLIVTFRFYRITATSLADASPCFGVVYCYHTLTDGTADDVHHASSRRTQNQPKRHLTQGILFHSDFGINNKASYKVLKTD